MILVQYEGLCLPCIAGQWTNLKEDILYNQKYFFTLHPYLY